MANSKLKEIISRIEKTMVADEPNRTRHFAHLGEEVCAVTYQPEENLFKLEDFKNQQTYQFDDIDLVAIEVYEIL
ncbi:MAG: DUF1797 family protein [Bavariicoccus seileri]|nr:DUF1797 family protein [Bavariicoccus seileri]